MTEDENHIDVADYLLPDGLSDEQVTLRLKDPLVRICNIYKIRDADGKIIPFVPNEGQCVILYDIYIAGIQRIAIPKARQIGFSTLMAIILFDRAQFSKDSSPFEGAIIDKTQPDAQAKLAKIKFAYERLPERLKDCVAEDNKGTIRWANKSSISAGMNARGRTPQGLHISEWGPIAFDDPDRSQEIITGALQSASGADALVVAESTHKGGKGGDWYDLIKRSLEIVPEFRTVQDFVVRFFPWWKEKRYTLAGDVRQIDKETNVYFAQKEKQIAEDIRHPRPGFKFTDGQRLFYFKKKVELKRKIFAEFPTTLEECWMAPFPGAIYAPEVDKARQSGRINTTVMHYEGFPVYSVFDIGAPVNTKCWLFQVLGDRINLLECLSGDDECNTAGRWVKRLKDKETYSYGGHFIPHDGETNWRASMQEAGLKGVVVLEKPHNEWDNINDAISAFSRCWFNLLGCQDGLDALEAFHSKEEADRETIRNVPCHDWASHPSTAFGYLHQAIRLGLLVDRSAMPARPRMGGGRGPTVHTGVSSHSANRNTKITVRR
jgi:hypothetical protein